MHLSSTNKLDLTVESVEPTGCCLGPTAAAAAAASTKMGAAAAASAMIEAAAAAGGAENYPAR